MMRTFCLLAAAMMLQSPLRAQAQKRNLTQFLEETVSAERCAPADKRAGMIKAVQSRFADRALAVVDGPALPAAQAVAEVVTAGCMRSLAPARTAGLALAAYGAVMRGAHPGVVRAIASYGLDKDVSEERIRAWADGYAQMTAGRVPAEAASEAVRNALDHGWSDKTFNEVKWGLVHAAKSGFDLKEFSSFVFARMLKDKTRPGAAVAEAQAAFAKAAADGKKPAVPAYQGLFIPFVQEPPKAEEAPKSDAAEAGTKADEAIAAGRSKGPVKPAAGPRAEARDKSGLCVPTRVEVRADSPKASMTPLKDILAANPDACKMEITLHAGEYPGDLTITADTAIRGRSGSSPVIKGRIDNLSGKVLLLEGVKVSGAKGRGVEQNGGKLFMKDVRVERVQATSDIASGRGVVVRGGAQALFQNVTLEGNAGGGLLATGEGTVAHAVELIMNDNMVLPAAAQRYSSDKRLDFLGTLEVSSRAMFFGDNLVMDGNQCLGILTLNGARAHMKNLSVSGTKRLSDPNAKFGHNIYASGDARLELVNFKSTRAENFGLLAKNSYLKGRDGIINHNPIGVSIIEPPPGFKFTSCLTPDVFCTENEVNFSLDEQETPSTTQGEPASCPGVPWIEAPAFP